MHVNTVCLTKVMCGFENKVIVIHPCALEITSRNEKNVDKFDKSMCCNKNKIPKEWVATVEDLKRSM